MMGKERLHSVIYGDARTYEKYSACGNQRPEKSLFAVSVGEFLVCPFGGTFDSYQ
jgi:hypothetical protein